MSIDFIVDFLLGHWYDVRGGTVYFKDLVHGGRWVGEGVSDEVVTFVRKDGDCLEVLR